MGEATIRGSTIDVPDRYLYTYWTLLFLGMAMLFPFNAFIAAPDYMDKYYRYATGNSTAEPQYPHIWSNIESYISVATMIPNFICEFAVITNWGRSLKMQTRLIWSMVVIVVSMLVVPVIPYIQVSELAAICWVLGAVVLCGAGTAFLQATSYGLAALFPPIYMQGVMLGTGVSGTFISLLRVVTKSSIAHPTYAENKVLGMVYYGIAILWIFVCLISVVLLKTNRFAQEYVQEYRFTPLAVGDEEDPLLGDKRSVDKTRVIKIISPMLVAVAFNFLVSLTVFPGVVTSIESKMDKGWFGVIIVLLFNAGDTSGRLICRFSSMWVKPQRVIPMSFIRVVFIPLFMFCVNPRYFYNDYIPLIMMYVTGLTNGYVATMSMMYGSVNPMLKDHGEREVAGTAMAIGLLGGLSGGSLLDLLITSQVKPKPYK